MPNKNSIFLNSCTGQTHVKCKCVHTVTKRQSTSLSSLSWAESKSRLPSNYSRPWKTETGYINVNEQAEPAVHQQRKWTEDATCWKCDAVLATQYNGFYTKYINYSGSKATVYERQEPGSCIPTAAAVCYTSGKSAEVFRFLSKRWQQPPRQSGNCPFPGIIPSETVSLIFVQVFRGVFFCHSPWQATYSSKWWRWFLDAMRKGGEVFGFPKAQHFLQLHLSHSIVCWWLNATMNRHRILCKITSTISLTQAKQHLHNTLLSVNINTASV